MADMSQSYTTLETFTTADVGKVLDCFAADFDGMGQSTGLRTREDTKAVAADIKLMAQCAYLSEVSVYLKDADGRTIRAAKYQVTTSAGLLTASRPGNYLWPRIPNGELGVVVTHNDTWLSESAHRRAAFRQGLNRSWGPASIDTSFPTLTRQFDRSYVSNGFGLMKSVYV